MTPAAHINYEEYDQKMSDYESAVRKLGGEIQYLHPSHPVKKHLKSLVRELKNIPEEVLTDFLKKRHAKLFGPKGLQNK